jgi:aldehyde:ferredoxin oxidoreductase
MDTISVGQVIGFAFEAFELGYITREDSGGLDLSWGNGETVVRLTEMIGEREGIGHILGRGIKRACSDLSIDDSRLHLHVKGMELPSHDPRAFVSVALGYATSPRGACHLQAFSHGVEAWHPLPELGFPEVTDRFSLDRKAELTAVMQNLMCIFDSLKLCKFLLSSGVSIATMVDWLNLVTGWDYDLNGLLMAGERIFTIKRLFNLREGGSAADDTLPVRVRSGPGGEHLEELLLSYYRFRGWSEAGVPTTDRLQRIGLELPVQQ